MDNTTNVSPHDVLTHLLQTTITRYISAEAQIEQITSSPITPGLSGTRIQRHHFTLKTPQGPKQASLVTKEAGLLERRILTILNEQAQQAIPFSHTLDLTTDGPALLCLQDISPQPKSASEHASPSNLLMQKAQGLATIHATNRSQRGAFSWLPRADRSYVTTYIQQRFWRPAWERVVHDPAFIQLFGAEIPQVEAAAATIADEMDTLYQEDNTLTLVHADLNPSNVIVYENAPYFIDWELPRYGSFYLDLPHLFPALEQAEYYRQALEEAEIRILPEDFAVRYRIAARFVGLRYLWLPLKAWQADHTRTTWVRHYLSMIIQ
ncbi:hypothetical protein KDW_39660 [Dictyobacter vulcani]|uniref:Aminoglycoside phosphotransferase domain-containing protein n=1 Tax=Dictyobacter vulcani TaxID=2607529 RepID=A0A5J4KJY5_9CHLR|nr:phosphotransferase [Dictyobacter vulcani]GER89804.1 hypothetical protein KDW_39660 [Dictyobacter vulcani]